MEEAGWLLGVWAALIYLISLTLRDLAPFLLPWSAPVVTMCVLYRMWFDYLHLLSLLTILTRFNTQWSMDCCRGCGISHLHLLNQHSSHAHQAQADFL
jgi:hypothetical protein